ncbi:response regulator [Biomaibacter acetigenes]|uniref:Stage 0 sporulation protein A homolog n=1 Tax=Biomaibacter acetigenes TaxID=2316383 RepID=A0A3G2R4C7_9FIRM|nr:response regulator transcription factor [Biomaibacter acetigenes]AYO29777.1 response regulator [Biomaibacter acetigenes]RKL61451.1 DNA-binding response regulator [Thermoanaerobacteraceae bacterium SP2]
MRILVVEDQPSLLKTIARRLQEDGYSVDTAKDGEEGLDFALVSDYDCIVLDIMLPVIDGMTVLKRLRENNIVTPVLFLTAKDAIEDRVRGLDLGADDYLIKPFSFDELLARIRALLRRQSISRETVIKIKDLTLDTNTHAVTRGGKPIELTAKEYAVLEYLMRNKGRLLTRSQIADHVWNYDFEGNSNIVDVYIRYLRRKIDDGFEDKLIQTVRGSGYMMRGES